MFRKIDDFLTTWEQESKGTQKLLDAITDASLSQAVADGHRTIGRLAWHIATTIPEMGGQTGLNIEGGDYKSTPPADAASIQAAYKKAATSLASEVRAKWDDDTLAVEDELYGERWARGKTLNAVVAHEIHHRGQLTVLMRQAGLTVPGIYGPSKEEWANFGMTDPEA